MIVAVSNYHSTIIKPSFQRFSPVGIVVYSGKKGLKQMHILPPNLLYYYFVS